MCSDLDQALLLAQGFQPAVYFKLNCKNCGISWRFALSPDQRPLCPKCADKQYRGRQLGYGYTRRELPLAECWRFAHEDATADIAVTFRDTIHGGVYFSKMALIDLWKDNYGNTLKPLKNRARMA